MHCEPAEILFEQPNQTRQIKVVAQWQDGTREDVTCLARFQTNNDAIVRVNRDGLATSNLRRRASGHLSMRMAGTHAMKVFGKPDRSLNCDCKRVNEPTLLQAIFTQNDPLVRMRIADSGWLVEIEDLEAAGKHIDRSELVDRVWLRTVGRNPSAEERRRTAKHLSSAKSVAEGIADLVWAMMNTKEFLLNH